MNVRIKRGLILALVIVAIVTTALWDRVRLAIEERSVTSIKAQRLVRYELGLPLPGTPDTDRLDARLAEQGFGLGSPVFIRIFKAESELEIWFRREGRFHLFATYPICRWSGQLGPKLQQGDRQSPEGFYSVTREQLNPNSRWHRSFNIGFPNALDRAHKRTGTFLMVHGGCSSVGCYAMTDPVIAEIWRLVTAALDNGQPRFDVHIFPFRLTPANMALRTGSPWQPFWLNLQTGYEHFEADGVPPKVSVCNGVYAFERAASGAVDFGPSSAACPAPEARPLPSPVKTTEKSVSPAVKTRLQR